MPAMGPSPSEFPLVAEEEGSSSDDSGSDSQTSFSARRWGVAAALSVLALGAAALGLRARHPSAAVRPVLLEGLEAPESGCTDTPGWANGWSHCAYEEGGKDAELCRTTPGASWPSTMGWTCKAYARKGWCTAQSQEASVMGAASQFPESHCCACGGGRMATLAAPPADICYTAKPGELCYKKVTWAMKEGLTQHPAWYPGLTRESAFEDFQAAINQADAKTCPMPCPKVAEECHTAEVFEKCHENVRWAMTAGVYEHPEWYPGVTPTSSFEDFQKVLHTDPTHECPMPCAPVPASEKPCYTAVTGEDCYTSVIWAMSEGIYSNPEWYPGLSNASSFEEFQANLHAANSTACPNRPCLVQYEVSPYTALRAPFKKVMKGIAYGPSPLKQANVRLANDDFMSNAAAVQWAPWGRGDLAIIKRLGANTVRMYGNDPNKIKRAFLDQSLKTGLDIVVGLSDFPFLQSDDHCSKLGWYCFDQIYAAYKQNLKSGFTIDNYKTYHPALKAVIIMNEPDLKIAPRNLMCRAMITALDGILQAEKDMGVTGNPIAFTVTFSFAVMGGPPALGQMGELYKCISNPEAPPTSYKPRNNVLQAYVDRFVNSFNTASPAEVIQTQFMDKYVTSGFWTDRMKIPVFIGEYHDVHTVIQDDLQAVLKVVQDRRYPFFLGVNFFEYSVRYDKGGTEMDFGMFGFGNCNLAMLPLDDTNYTVWDLTPRKDKTGKRLDAALQAAYGGRGLGPREAVLSSGPGPAPCLRVTPLDSPTSLAAGLPTYWEKE